MESNKRGCSAYICISNLGKAVLQYQIPRKICNTGGPNISPLTKMTIGTQPLVEVFFMLAAESGGEKIGARVEGFGEARWRFKGT